MELKVIDFHCLWIPYHLSAIGHLWWSQDEKELGSRILSNRKDPRDCFGGHLNYWSNWASLYSSSHRGVENKQTKKEIHIICICEPDWRQANINDTPIQTAKHMGGSAGRKCCSGSRNFPSQLVRLADCWSHMSSEKPVLWWGNRSLIDSNMTLSLFLWSWMNPDLIWVGSSLTPAVLSELSWAWAPIYCPSSGLGTHNCQLDLI